MACNKNAIVFPEGCAVEKSKNRECRHNETLVGGQTMPQMRVYNPPSPFLVSLHAKGSLNRRVTIRGEITTERQAIQLQSGPNPETSNVQLRLAMWTSKKEIVRRSVINGRWDDPETTGVYPFKDDDFSYELQITVNPTAFDIVINGSHIASFKHRVPFAEIKYLHVDDGGIVNSVIVESGPFSENSGHTGSRCHSGRPRCHSGHSGHSDHSGQFGHSGEGILQPRFVGDSSEIAEF